MLVGDVAPAAAAEVPTERSLLDRLPSAPLTLALWAVLVAPLVVALVALRRTTWYPVLDLAMTEFRVRDVFTAHTPLIGLPGRIGRTLAQQGSHPGPLSFYVLAPTYRLFGKTAWALQTGTVVLHAAAIGAALFIARRRGGVALVLGVAATLAVLTRGYGLSTMTEPWNPYMPLLWWMVFLLAVWSVVCGDVVLLPVAVFAASFCAQTHVPYLANTLGMATLALAGVVLAYRRAVDRDGRRRVVVWTALAFVLGLLLWFPPVLDQIVHRPGNFRLLYEHFTDPPEKPVGFGTGLRLALLHLDVFSLASGQGGATGSLVVATSEPTGSVVPGLAVLAVWAAAAITSWRLRRRRSALFGLHVVVAAGLAVGAVSMARIFGDLWYYLMLWAWGVAALLVVAVVWTGIALLEDRLDAPRRRTWSVAGAGLLATVTVVSALLFAVDAADAQPPAPRLSATLGGLVAPTVHALDAGVGGATGKRGRYVITWSDALHIGSEAYGLVSELERRGYTHVGMTEGLHVPLTDYRVVQPADATLEIHFATGTYLDQWRAMPDAKEVAFVEPRTPAQRREFDRLRTEAIAQLQAEGLEDVVPHVDDNLFGASIDHRVPASTRKLMARMLDLGEPTAVFFVPAGTTP
jgi:hypothetical protein